MKGKFITFEGSEGCGKSTQSKLLYEYLKQEGYRAVYLREPGGVKASEKIRKLLLDPKNKISPPTETLLYMAARAEVVSEIIIPALAGGKIVVCDRFLDSTICYQGYGLGVDIKTIKFIGNFATSSIEPDLTIFLDLAVKKGLKHRHLQEDRIEQRSFTYHQRVRKGYLELASLNKKRIKIVKPELDIFLTQEKIRKLCHSIILKAKIR